MTGRICSPPQFRTCPSKTLSVVFTIALSLSLSICYSSCSSSFPISLPIAPISHSLIDLFLSISFQIPDALSPISRFRSHNMRTVMQCSIPLSVSPSFVASLSMLSRFLPSRSLSLSHSSFQLPLCTSFPPFLQSFSLNVALNLFLGVSHLILFSPDSTCSDSLGCPSKAQNSCIVLSCGQEHAAR